MGKKRNRMAVGEEVTVISRKYDGSIRRSWKCRLIKEEPPLLEFVGKFDREVVHSDLGIIRRGTVSYEYYWTDRWYNVFRFHEPEGELKFFYCNINTPPTFENRSLDYIDLDIDLLVKPDYSVIVLDEHEFEENAELYAIPEEVRQRARKCVDELMSMIKRREFPFGVTD
jgi:protein associated with RNAse G/E